MKRVMTFLLLLMAVVVRSEAQMVLTHPWAGKRVAYFGDSITDPRNKASVDKYWSFLERWLSITPYVYGVSGRQWNDIPRQAEALQSEHGDSVDAIIIFIGTNDYNQGVPIGQWYTETDEKVYYARGHEKSLVDRKQQHLCMADSTYRGRINIALSKVKSMYPTKQIVLMTPIHRGGFYPNEKNWQPTEDYRNSCGEYLSAYVESVKEAGNVWAVPVIDLNSLCGLYPMLESHAQFFNRADTDRLHPNDAGHERMARTIMYQLMMLPCE